MALCPHCNNDVIPSADGACPHCRQPMTATTIEPTIAQINPYKTPTAEAEHHKPVKIKAYGFIPMTRNFYYALQVVMLVGTFILLLALRPMFAKLQPPFNLYDKYLWLIIAVVILGELGETYFMLKKFKKAEQKQTAQKAGEDSVS